MYDCILHAIGLLILLQCRQFLYMRARTSWNACGSSQTRRTRQVLAERGEGQALEQGESLAALRPAAALGALAATAPAAAHAASAVWSPPEAMLFRVRVGFGGSHLRFWTSACPCPFQFQRMSFEMGMGT